jgi:hypothetical protein
MRARRAVLLSLLLLSGSICACGEGASAPEPTPASQVTPTLVARASPTPTPLLGFETRGDNFYEDPVGSLRFLFDVQNTNRIATERLWATVRLVDGDGQVVASESGYVRMDLLEPGESAPAMVVFFLSSPDFASYEIGVEAREADYLPQLLHEGLQITEEATRVGEWVPYEVLGLVENTADVDAESVTLTVTCYDRQGRVVAISTGRPEERKIEARESSEFLVTVGTTAGEVAACTVQAEGLIATDD